MRNLKRSIDYKKQKQSWPQERIELFLKTEHIGSQRILLPYGLSTNGEDLSEVASLIFPDNLVGKTVLDASCSLGFFALEAYKRGATQVLAVDANDQRIRQARTIAEILGIPVEYRSLDIEKDCIQERFDYVLFLNALHRLADITRERMILEVPGIEFDRVQRYLWRKFNCDRKTQQILARLPIAVIGRNGTAKHKYEQKYFFTTESLRNILLHHRRLFSAVHETTSPTRGETILHAKRRQIKNLVIVSGPTASGKSTLLDHLIITGKESPIASSIGIDPKVKWLNTNSSGLREIEGQYIENLLFHYDLLRPWGRDTRTYHRDEGLDVTTSCKRLEVLTLLSTRQAMIKRLEEELGGIEDQNSQKATRIRNVIQLYHHSGRIKEILNKWTRFCTTRKAKLVFIDATKDYKILDYNEWINLLD